MLFMKSEAKLLGIVGSHRKGGNSYQLVKTVFDSFPIPHEIVELAEKDVLFCTICEQCIDKDCVLQDDFNDICREMEKADGIVFSLPKYLFVSSKFIAFLERLNTVHHMRKYRSYAYNSEVSDYTLFKEKPACILFTSGLGVPENEIARIVAEYTECLGLKLIRPDEAPFTGVSIKAGDAKGEVLHNERGIEECKKMVERVLESIKK